ncbi:murein DD-endopeptidase MepM/ murein hydrolase activator NlpD [Silvibacterium bohemicum]|uniref:Murein DD-endopeptidase MepM/ murein hydrolase activator NlpD n=1 Tax=Silvibacterium bohemicum TaxID=1577686 RepID=A0A841K019_9BACT|nr:M23 family metallopeptidase [Silvibacterium bohemicum]MBB6145957.1 murein DD-endopeptidase MepM/ murein hydrolase activator NlpD [Silvibacterium bohemicum]
MRIPVIAASFLSLPLFLALAGCSKPSLIVPASLTTIGQATPVTVQVHDTHGVSKLTVSVTQNGAQYQAWQSSAASKSADTTFNFNVGVKTTPQLRDGKAHLIIEAISGGLFHSRARWEGDVNVVTEPPVVSADSDQHYLYLGMADLATLNVTGSYTSAGVRVGDQTFRAWPMPGGKPGLISLFAFAWNMPQGTAPLVFASNGAGNDVTTPLTVVFPKREQPVYTQHEIQVTDQFMQKVLGELDPNGAGDPVARFVRINTEMRKANNQTLSDLRFKTADHFLWSQPFTRQSHSQAEATFADVRSYIYHGKKIDQQVHLGYDLAVTQHVGVEASNDGRIVWAAPLGIYGNCVVVDHGYGLQTIYGHMSRIDVHVGDMVKRSQIMGLSGMTGMAGGDHVHFAMQLDGVQIDPKEWWDAHWIHDHIARRVDLPGFGK